MRLISLNVIYTLWLREMKRFLRAKSRIVGSIIQALLIFFISLFFGFRILHLLNLLPAFFIMLLIAVSFVGLGVALASRMEDIHGFQLVMNFIIMPIFFLSGALFPLEGLPGWLAKIILH